jgi:hypothetical protein
MVYIEQNCTYLVKEENNNNNDNNNNINNKTKQHKNEKIGHCFNLFC